MTFSQKYGIMRIELSFPSRGRGKPHKIKAVFTKKAFFTEGVNYEQNVKGYFVALSYYGADSGDLRAVRAVQPPDISGLFAV